MNKSKLIAFTMLTLLSSPIFAQQNALRDLSVEQTTAANAGAAIKPGSLRVSISADRADATYAVNETARLFINTNEEAYVTVLNVGASGRITQLFPNRFQTDNKIPAGQQVEIAGGATGARITVAGPVGNELIKVIASNKPINVVAEAQLQDRAAFRVLDNGVRALTRDLEVMGNEASRDERKISINNFSLHTIASRPAAAPGQQQAIVVMPGAQSIPGAAPGPLPSGAPGAPAFNIPSVQAFPLILGADKANYKPGEKVALAVTTMQACNLSVLGVSTRGEVRALFPNAATPNAALAAGATAIISGGPASGELLASSTPGVERVIAICSTDPAPVTSGGAPADDRALSRDLALVASRPAGTTSVANLSFTVQP